MTDGGRSGFSDWDSHSLHLRSSFVSELADYFGRKFNSVKCVAVSVNLMNLLINANFDKDFFVIEWNCIMTAGFVAIAWIHDIKHARFN